MIHDPFGEDVLDFPLHAYIEELKDDIMAFEACGVANPAVHETPASGSAGAGEFPFQSAYRVVPASHLHDRHIFQLKFEHLQI